MAQPLPPGDPARLGAYELVGRLGEGAQGVVYRGRDREGREVAVKLLHAQLSGDPAARSRFVRELEVAERVAGFCTAQVLDADVAGDRPYIVSEYVVGPSLKESVEESGPFDPDALTRLAIGTATALAAIHRAGIVHRDFKPPNVLMGPDGPRVIDFGIARALDSSSITMTSQVVGTPAYMAPEQVAAGAVGAHTDMFGWAGAMLYAATGRPPFGADSIPAVMHRVLHADADLSVLPPGLAGLVGSCLAKDPARRPSAADVVLQLLGQVGAVKPGRLADNGELLAQAATLVTSEFHTPPPPPFPPPPPYVVQQQSWGTQPAAGPGAPSPLAAHRGARVPWLIAGGVLAVAVAIAALLVVPRGGGKASTATAGSPTVKLAFLGALSGASEPVGRPMFNGARLAVQEYNATNPAIRAGLVTFDSQGEPARAAGLTRQIIDGGFAGVIGPGFSGEAQSAVPALAKEAVPMVSPGASATGLSTIGGRYWHRVVPGNDTAVRSLADLMVRAGKARRAVVMDDENAWTAQGAQVAAAALAAKGVKVTRLRVRSNAGDYAAELKKIKEARPDAVFYGGFYEPAARLIKQARRAGLKTRFFLTDQTLAAGFVELAGRAEAQGTVLSCACFDPSGSSAEPVRRFRDLYQKANSGEAPGLYTAEGYDSATAFIAALKAGQTTREGINGRLRSLNVPGLSRRIGFTETGDPVDDTTYVYTVVGGQITIAGPAKTTALP